MNRLRVSLLMTLILLPASRLPGQVRAIDQGGGVYNTPVVCNDGTLVFSVARAFREISQMHGDQWTAQGWYSVRPGQCNEIGPEQLYMSGGWFGADSVTLLAFAFTDSTGVWGAARVRDSTDGVFKASNQQLCVMRDNFRGVHKDSEGGPAADCAKGRPGLFLIPASFEFKGDAYGGFYGHYVVNKGGRDLLHVRLGANDRAIPLGAQTSSGVAAPGPGTTEDLLVVLKDTIRGPGAPRFRGSPAGSFVEVCVPSALVKKQSWANPQSARAKALKDAIRQFTGSHNFVGGGKARLRVTESLDRFMVEEVKACSDDEDDDFNMASP